MISLVVLHSISLISFHLRCMIRGSIMKLNEEQPTSVN